MNTEQYIGMDKVVGIIPVGQKTPQGNEIILITFNGASPIQMTKKAFDLLVSEEPTEPTVFQKKKIDLMLPEIIGVIAEFDIQAYETDALLRGIMNHLQNSFDRANNYLWTQDDSRWAQGLDSTMFRSLLEADKIIKSIPQNDTTTEAESQ